MISCSFGTNTKISSKPWPPLSASIATGLMAVEVVDQRLRLRGVMTAGVAELRLIGIGHYQ